MHPLQAAFARNHALQCGFCTPGFLMASIDLLTRNPDPDDDAIRKGLAGNTCRCTGYLNIIAAVKDAALEMKGEPL
jgi:aerobic carbon-monoxide dehydrogenase small subunit